jgi:hypothetical protein
MWTIVKRNYKTILAIAGLLLIANIVLYLLEEYYRKLVRLSFKFFNGDNIQFYGKYFHLKPSDNLIIAISIFTLLTYLLLKFSSRPKRLKRTLVTINIFFAMTILITALDSKLQIIACTACDDGILILSLNNITYDKYFIVSLIASFTYLLTTYLLERKQFAKRNETI